MNFTTEKDEFKIVFVIRDLAAAHLKWVKISLRFYLCGEERELGGNCSSPPFLSLLESFLHL